MVGLERMTTLLPDSGQVSPLSRHCDHIKADSPASLPDLLRDTKQSDPEPPSTLPLSVVIVFLERTVRKEPDPFPSPSSEEKLRAEAWVRGRITCVALKARCGEPGALMGTGRTALLRKWSESELQKSKRTGERALLAPEDSGLLKGITVEEVRWTKYCEIFVKVPCGFRGGQSRFSVEADAERERCKADDRSFNWVQPFGITSTVTHLAAWTGRRSHSHLEAGDTGVTGVYGKAFYTKWKGRLRELNSAGLAIRLASPGTLGCCCSATMRLRSTGQAKQS
ncbi:hypothetical protein EYF80_031695 [Liparis tanakae]|uniref:Uncharacterized protein n=1 Tax=Liparis tanakae TaxID=230148 RepID=A0A4Z2GX44_9TELE|nr:hypothetical protein EYF80_031695 [Liparis tanakae]